MRSILDVFPLYWRILHSSSLPWASCVTSKMGKLWLSSKVFLMLTSKPDLASDDSCSTKWKASCEQLLPYSLWCALYIRTSVKMCWFEFNWLILKLQLEFGAAFLPLILYFLQQIFTPGRNWRKCDWFVFFRTRTYLGDYFVQSNDLTQLRQIFLAWSESKLAIL